MTDNVPAQIDRNALQIAESAAACVSLAQGFKIVERSGFTIAAERLRTIKQMQKQLEDKRTSVTGPLNEAIRAINDWFRQPGKRLKEAEDIYKDEMGRFEREEQERIRRETAAAAEKARLEREELERRASKAAEAGKIEKAQELQARAETVTPPRPSTVAPQSAGIGFGEDWCFEVVDVSKLPRTYMTPDLVKIGQLVRAMKGGAGELLGEGVRVWSKPRVIASSRK